MWSTVEWSFLTSWWDFCNILLSTTQTDHHMIRRNYNIIFCSQQEYPRRGEKSELLYEQNRERARGRRATHHRLTNSTPDWPTRPWLTNPTLDGPTDIQMNRESQTAGCSLPTLRDECFYIQHGIGSIGNEAPGPRAVVSRRRLLESNRNAIDGNLPAQLKHCRFNWKVMTGLLR